MSAAIRTVPSVERRTASGLEEHAHARDTDELHAAEIDDDRRPFLLEPFERVVNIDVAEAVLATRALLPADPSSE